MLQCNIISVIFVKDGNHYYFYSLGGSWCQNLWLLWSYGHQASNWRRHIITLTFDLQPVNGVTSRPCHGLPPANLPFSTWVRHRQTDRHWQTTSIIP